MLDILHWVMSSWNLNSYPANKLQRLSHKFAFASYKNVPTLLSNDYFLGNPLSFLKHSRREQICILVAGITICGCECICKSIIALDIESSRTICKFNLNLKTMIPIGMYIQQQCKYSRTRKYNTHPQANTNSN